MKFTRWMIFALIFTLWGLIGTVSAQGGLLTYGETRSEALTDASPQVLYSFNGNADEVVTVYVLSWNDTFQPSLTILGPTGQIAFTSSDALSPIFNDARATVRLPAAGNYSMLVGSANNIFGNYTIALRLTTPGISTQLSAEPVTLDIPPGGQSQAFTLPASPDSAIPVTIASSTADFIFSAQVSAPDGRVVMAVDGALSSVNAVLPPGDGTYTIVVRASNATDSGTLTISQSGDVPVVTTNNTGGGESPAPAATEEVGSTNPPPTDQCAAIAGGSGVNVRSGPGTNYDVIGGLSPNANIVVTGQNNGWYTGTTVFGQGWVAGSVVSLSGPCNNLPFVEAPAAPVAPVATQAPSQPTATYTATTANNNNNNNQPTATYTATYTVTPTATEAQQLAPIDSDVLNFTVDRDAGGQFTNDVSSPNGDTTDRIRITIDNLFNQPPNNFREMNILITCFGEGAENLRWGSGGPSSPSPRACNESISATHTNDSNQTFLNVNLTGTGYVTYTVIVTITS